MFFGIQLLSILLMHNVSLLRSCFSHFYWYYKGFIPTGLFVIRFNGLNGCLPQAAKIKIRVIRVIR